MSPRRRLALLALTAFGASLGSCRQRSRNVAKPAGGTDSGAPVDVTGPVVATSGSYQCTLRTDDEEFLIAKCDIAPNQTVVFSGPETKLTARLHPQDYGFLLEGNARIGASNYSLSSELFRQGAGSYAAVLSSSKSGAESASQVRLTMVPKAPGTATAR